MAETFTKETLPSPLLYKMKAKTRDRKSKAIWKYLDSHPLIQNNWLSKEIGWDRSNFKKYRIRKARLPQPAILRIEEILKDYGMNII